MFKKISLSTLFFFSILSINAQDIIQNTPLIDNEGFTITSLWRGLLGMISLFFLKSVVNSSLALL